MSGSSASGSVEDPLGLGALRSSAATPLAPQARLWRLAALEKSDLWVVVVYAIVIGLVSLAVPIAAQALVSTVAFTALVQPIIVLSLLVLIGLVAAGILRTLQYKVIETLQERFFVRATHESVRQLAHADLTAFSEHGAPEVMNRFFDVATVQKAASTLLLDGLSVVLQAGVSLVLLAFYHPALLAFDVVLIVLIGTVLVGLGRNGVDTAIKESKAKYETVAWLEEMASATRTFKANGADRFAFERADGLARDYLYSRRKHFSILLRQIIASYILQALATSALLGLGGYLVVKGELSLGQLVAAELIVTGILAGVAKFGKYLETYYDLAAAVDKVGVIIDLPTERVDGAFRKSSDTPLHLCLDSVTFSYDDQVPALRALSLDIAPGKRIAVLGGDASGKSTLVDLLYGLRTAKTGRVLVDGVDVRLLSLRNLRRDIAVVGKAEVFDANLQENILLGRDDVDATKTAELLNVVSLTEELGSLADGGRKRLGHWGNKLTSSQAARVTIARGLVAKPRLLVIDEALDGLGVDTARTILARIAALPNPMSILVFTSSREIALEVGDFVRLERGSITEREESRP